MASPLANFSNNPKFRVNVPIRSSAPQRRPRWPRSCSGGKYSYLRLPILHPSRPLLPGETYREDHPCPDDIHRIKELWLSGRDLLVGAIVPPHLSPSLFPMTFDGIPSVGVIASLGRIDENSYVIHGLQRFEVISSLPRQHVFVRIIGHEPDTFDGVASVCDLTVHERLALLLSTDDASRDAWLEARGTTRAP